MIASLIVTVSWLKSGWPITAAIRFIRTSFHQRGDDQAEGDAQNYGDGELDHVSAERELLELLPHGGLPQIRSSGGVWFHRRRWRRWVAGAPTSRYTIGPTKTGSRQITTTQTSLFPARYIESSGTRMASTSA